MLTRALARTRARVVAVELDARLAKDLRRIEGEVRVVEADARRFTWPRAPFRVVANLPFAHGTDILRALLSDPAVPLRSADVIVQWELAAKRTRLWPSTALGVLWGAWYEVDVVRRIAPSAFAPSPSVAAGVLRASRRAVALVPTEEAHAYDAFVRRSFADAPLRRILGSRRVKRALHELGADRDARARDLDAAGWAHLYRSVRRTR
jgi:23S rRNA (adenine-N6)-dimethyltransferase